MDQVYRVTISDRVSSLIQVVLIPLRPLISIAFLRSVFKFKAILSELFLKWGDGLTWANGDSLMTQSPLIAWPHHSVSLLLQPDKSFLDMEQRKLNLPRKDGKHPTRMRIPRAIVWWQDIKSTFLLNVYKMVWNEESNNNNSLKVKIVNYCIKNKNGSRCVA